ncbi:MAG: tyrosine-type recombinase/integrase [Gammaproteobacteria bacterium]|nr:tyrosine-type recombinase/integrase [Gammaproteobacteria bacterium]
MIEEIEKYKEHLKTKFSKNTVWSYMTPVKRYAAWIKGHEEEETLKFMIKMLNIYLEEVLIKYPAKTCSSEKKRLRYFFIWLKENNLVPTDIALTQLDYLNAYIIEGTRQYSSKEIINHYIKEYENWLDEKGLAENTKVTYLNNIQLFHEWVESRGEIFEPSNITPSLVIMYKRSLSDVKKPPKPATINAKTVAVLSFCNFAVSKKYILENPLKYINSLFVEEVTTTDVKWLSLNEQYKVTHVLQRPGTPIMDMAIILLMLDAGLRASEVINLDMSDVTLKPVIDSNINIRDSKRNKTRSVPIRTSIKNDRGKIKHVGSRLHQALRDYKNFRTTQYGSEQTEAFFISHGKRITYAFINRLMAKYRKESHVQKLTPHALRHSFAKNLVDNKTEHNKVALMLGHTNKKGEANLQMVARYTKPSFQDLRDEINKLPE